MIPALNAGAVQGLPLSQIAQGAGALNFIRQLGGAFGTSLLSLLLQWRLAAHQHEAAAGSAAAALEVATRAFDDTFVAVGLVFLSALWPGWRIRRAAARAPD